MNIDENYLVEKIQEKYLKWSIQNMKINATL